MAATTTATAKSMADNAATHPSQAPTDVAARGSPLMWARLLGNASAKARLGPHPAAADTSWDTRAWAVAWINHAGRTLRMGLPGGPTDTFKFTGCTSNAAFGIVRYCRSEYGLQQAMAVVNQDGAVVGTGDCCNGNINTITSAEYRAPAPPVCANTGTAPAFVLRGQSSLVGRVLDSTGNPTTAAVASIRWQRSMPALKII